MPFNILSKQDLDDLTQEIYQLKERIADITQPEQVKWLPENKAMTFLDISKSTIQRYRKNGLLEFSQYQNKIYYKLEDLNEFLESNYTGNVKSDYSLKIRNHV